jgi:hypothetical protein
MRQHISVGFIKHTALLVCVPAALVCFGGVRSSVNSDVNCQNSASKKIPYVTRKLLSERDLLPHPSQNPKTQMPLSDAKQFMDRCGIAFVENKGQIIDTKGSPRPDLTYVANTGGVKLHFRNDGVSYVFSKSAKDRRKGKGFEKHDDEQRGAGIEYSFNQPALL